MFKVKSVEMNEKTNSIDAKDNFLKFAIFEIITVLTALILLTLIFIKFNNLALPVSTENGGIISFKAVKGVKLQELLGPVILIAITVTLPASYIYTRFIKSNS